MRIISDYLNNSEKSKLEDMRKLEGSNYGIHSIGYYDPVFIFLHRLQVLFILFSYICKNKQKIWYISSSELPQSPKSKAEFCKLLLSYPQKLIFLHVV